MSEKNRDERKASRATKPREPDNDTGPLAEEIETEMIDQDIPVETGVRPAPDKAR